MKRNNLLVTVIFAFTTSCCQVVTLAGPSHSLGAYSNQFEDVFSFTANPASLASLTNTAIGFHDEKKYMVGPDHFLAAAALVTSFGNAGLSVDRTGFGAYDQLYIGLAHARKLGKGIDIGVQFNYNTIRLAGYGSAAVAGFATGCLFHLTPVLLAGIHIADPVGERFGTAGQEKWPAYYSMGLGYQVSDLVFTGIELIKEEDRPPNVNAGIYYQVVSSLLIKTGIAAATSSIWIACCLLRKSWRLDISMDYHSQLGLSPGLSMLFNFKQGAVF